ncbi:hypothetical protein N7492_005239 [Penicillium capsulatum]|uniref:Uncharacterized protein n=1 Tax=Penicillium capsulatum TaxID=69766 RepID=A0A9W9LRG7_9EURO|nr:hypothetical protein N7492_005239 [Penicillium capsulatum]
MDEIDPDILGRHFMAHLIVVHQAALRRGDQANIPELVVSSLAQYEDLFDSDVDPKNPALEIARILSQYSDLQLLEESKAVLLRGLEEDHRVGSDNATGALTAA